MIYLDNAATTKISHKVRKAMLPYLFLQYGNPSSLHSPGQRAKEKVEQSRQIVANCLNADISEIHFTSGGSESNNWAIQSAAENQLKSGKNHIISSKFEHHSVMDTLKKLENQGFEVSYIAVNRDGVINANDFKNAIRPTTGFATIMFANNEIGTIQPIREIAKICSENKIIFHTDAVQAVGHLPVDVKDLNIDLLSFSAHKFHGPKGVGGLYIKKGRYLPKFIHGGTQENNKRAGTENVAGIAGLSAALLHAAKNMQKNAKKQAFLRDLLFEQLGKIEHSVINGHPVNRLANNFNMSFEGIEGESLILLLNDKKICASSGSACTSRSLLPSHVLLAIGLPHEVAHGSLRLTLSEHTTKRDITKTAKEVVKIVKYLRNISPYWDKLKKGEYKHAI